MKPMKEYNRLIYEKSPYLLQHAGNPVDWYPWGDEAFEKAFREDMPIFLSVGYSTCHWCHVMEKESFEDTDVAALMNDAFISIKVDREERPDIDAFYMNVCQTMTGSGGWPLTVLMTPDRKPFFAGTYFPKESRYGRIGMIELVPKVKELWVNERQKVLDSADNITSAVIKSAATGEQGTEMTESVFHEAFHQMEGMFDECSGGFGSRPKFPMPHYILFLLRYWLREKSEKAMAMAEKTLLAMGAGGIHDHIGYGFHRYSTDAGWVLPHFEKMLYDQAMLSMAYTEAFLATKRTMYRDISKGILSYVERDLTSPEGGFYSAEDADSEGVEGKFYVWTLDEMREALSDEELEFARKEFHLFDEGNFDDESTGMKTGANILFRSGYPDEHSKTMESIREKLLLARGKRVRPHKDDKVLVDWNGLMIAAYAKAAQTFGEERYRSSSKKAADFILNTMKKPDGRLMHRYRAGEAGINAYLDDYAFFIWGLLELYEASFDPRYLSEAVSMSRIVLQDFSDEEQGTLYLAGSGAEALPGRARITYDGAVPSGNAVMIYNMHRLAAMTGADDLLAAALSIERGLAEEAKRTPVAYAMTLVALDFRLSKVREVVIAGAPGRDDTLLLIETARSVYGPNNVMLFLSDERPYSDITKIAGFLESLPSSPQKATAYVCRDRACNLPVTDPAEMLKLLDS